MPKVFKSGGDLQEWRCKLSSATPLVDKSYNCPTSQNRSLETTIFLIFKYESRLAKSLREFFLYPRLDQSISKQNSQTMCSPHTSDSGASDSEPVIPFQ